MKILIVDDSLMDRKLTMNTLKKNGVENEVIQASDGEEGLKVLSEHYNDIGIILLDWQMPNMNGIEFMRGVINVPAINEIPIVMITASGSDENKKLAYEVNPNLAGYLVKPYSPKKLLETVQAHLKN